MSQQVLTVNQAGAVAFKLTNGAPRILLVTAKADPGVWIFPKGHIEPGESPMDTAKRELLEEAGIHGEPIAPLGRLEFASKGEWAIVDYYLFRCLRIVPMREEREIAWYSYDKALQKLPFEDAKGVLRSAWREIKRYSSSNKFTRNDPA